MHPPASRPRPSHRSRPPHGGFSGCRCASASGRWPPAPTSVTAARSHLRERADAAERAATTSVPMASRDAEAEILEAADPGCQAGGRAPPRLGRITDAKGAPERAQNTRHEQAWQRLVKAAPSGGRVAHRRWTPRLAHTSSAVAPCSVNTLLPSDAEKRLATERFTVGLDHLLVLVAVGAHS